MWKFGQSFKYVESLELCGVWRLMRKGRYLRYADNATSWTAIIYCINEGFEHTTHGY